MELITTVILEFFSSDTFEMLAQTEVTKHYSSTGYKLQHFVLKELKPRRKNTTQSIGNKTIKNGD